MKKVFLIILMVFFSSNLLAQRDEKNKLPDYKKWELFKYETLSLYATHINGCKDLNPEAISEDEKIQRKLFPNMVLYQYRNLKGTTGDFLDLIKDRYNKRELIFYNEDLFQRKKRFLFFGRKWEYIDTFPLEEEGKFEEWIKKISAFQLKHCLFFPTQ